jgi:PAS domain S-box-containing protein
VNTVEDSKDLQKNSNDLEPRDTTYDLLFQDIELQSALANVGVYISDYLNDRNFGSNLWADTGMPEDSMGLSYRWIEAIHPDDRNRVHESAARVMSGKEPLYQEQLRIRSANGDYRWIVSRGRGVGKQANGKPILFVGADTDITELKKTQESLEQYINELETMREVAAVISSSLNLQETVARVLEQTRRIIPYTTATVQLLEDGFLKVIGGFGFDDLSSVLKMKFPFPVQGSLSTKAIQALTPVKTGDVENEFPDFQPHFGGLKNTLMVRDSPVPSWSGYWSGNS